MDASPRDVSFARSVSGALGELVLASTALALLLSQTSARFAWNLPVAVAVVWATHALARVRVDARWDTGTRRLHVSVTRQRARDAPGTHADAPGASRAFSRRDADAPLAGSDAARAASEPEGTSACSSEPSQSRDAADGARLNSRNDETTKRVGSRTAACSAYSSPLRDALRERETNGEWNELLGSWARLRDRVVRTFVTDLWYAPITPDAQFPNAVSRVLDVAFAELARRARRADLAELLLETAPVIVAENLERFRRAREVVGGVDAYVRRTPREADAEMAPTLWPRELFGDASLEEIRPLSKALSRERSSHRVATSTSTGETFEEARDDAIASVSEDAIASAEPSPLLAAFEKHAHRVLSARCVAVADALLRETELSSPPRAPRDPLLRPLARELLVGCLLRPLLGFCSPAWAHRGLAAMLAAEDDVAAAPPGGEAPEPQDAPREGTEPTLLSARGGSAEVPETPETLFEEKEKKDSEDSSSRVFVAARVAEAHIAGKGASAYAVYTVRVRARTRASGDKETETETEWVVPRRFRNFEALHRRCEKEASETGLSDSPDVSDSRTRTSVVNEHHARLAFAPMPSLPKKRFALNSLDGAFVEARRAALDRYLVALVSCPARAARSAATDAFFDPATVTGPFAPEPDRNTSSSFGAFASHTRSLSSSAATSVVEPRSTVAGEPRRGDGERPGTKRAPRPPAVPRAESCSEPSAIGTNTAPASERTPRKGSSLSHRRAASSGAIPGAFFVKADGPMVAAAAPKEAAPKERAAPPRARRSFPDLASATFSSNTDDVTARDRDVSEVTAVDSLARGGLLRLFESVFHLRAKGVVRRTVVALARQTLEFFAGAAVEDLAAAKLRALRSPETAKAAVDLIERALWPGGVWHRTAQARARAADNPGGGAGTGDAAALAGPFSEVEAARAEEERVRLKVRDALLASWSRGPLYNLVGARNCTRAGLDVLGVARSELLCARVGLEAMLAALDAAFPESAVARRDETAYL